MLIRVHKLKKSFGNTIVLNGIDLEINCNDRIGLVGRNGCGKTTLANILTGSLEYDEGNIIVTARKQIIIGYLQQMEMDPELYLNTLDARGEFQRWASNLGIKALQDWPKKRLQNLSGGERTKLALARVWAAQPDLVILDEPTNHMDYQAITFLISQLEEYQGAALVISHDRYFLDQTVKNIAELENGVIKIYPGNHSAYRDIKQKELESRQHTYDAQQKEQKQVENAITRLKMWSDKAHRESRQKAGKKMGAKEYYRKKAKKRDQAIKSQIKRLEKMQQRQIERPPKELQVNFDLHTSFKGSKRLLEANEISKCYGELTLFKDSSFYIKSGEKIGLFGPNGCGKTTLIKIIMGQASLDSGKIFVSQAARIAYVGQDLPPDEKKPLTSLVKRWRIDKQKLAFKLLVQLGIPFDRLSLPMEKLSRGERMKIAIGLAILDQYDVLLLDEPTNHLDLYSREALEESLVKFTGTLVIASHDRYLLQQVCDHLLVFENHKINRIEGKINGYLNNKEPQSQSDHQKSFAIAHNEQLLLLETKISQILGELSRHKPEDPEYITLDQEFTQLIKRKNEIKRLNQ
ncbi:MAG: ribosomal protection-like ABC-F family protein [Syntrophomonadaceae bacterium]